MKKGLEEMKNEVGTMFGLRGIVESRGFQVSTLCVIVFNAILFGLQTSSSAVRFFGPSLGILDGICLWVFTVELVLKLIVYNRRFCSDPWNVFDFVIVAISFVPDCGMFSALRIFRVFRLFKIISGVRQMRVILSAIVKSIPGIMWASMLLLLIYYVYGIIGTNLFGVKFEAWFGTLGRSVYSLFQIMTLESWSMGIARPVIAEYPYAWIYFVSYILASSFIVMNIVVGIVLNSIGDSFKSEKPDGACSEDALTEELRKLKEQISIVEAEIAKKEGK